MSFLHIKDPAERATLVKEYVTAMKTVKQRNMANRELKLAIGGELQTHFHPISNATKQAAEETRKELESMKKTLRDIDGALTAQRVDAAPPLDKSVDTTFGVYRRQVVQVDMDKKTLTVDGTVYDFIPGQTRYCRKNRILVSGLPVIIKHINLFVHRPRLDLARICHRKVLLDQTLDGNTSICLGKWLCLEKG